MSYLEAPIKNRNEAGPFAFRFALSHDSYTCRKFPDTTAFPTKREAGVGNYVGSVVRDTFQIELSILPIDREIRFLGKTRSNFRSRSIISKHYNCISSVLDSQFGRTIEHIRGVEERHMPDQVQAA